MAGVIKPVTARHAHDHQSGEETGRRRQLGTARDLPLLARVLAPLGSRLFCLLRSHGRSSEFRVPSSERRVPSGKFRVPSSERRVPSSELKVPSGKSVRLRRLSSLGTPHSELGTYYSVLSHRIQL